MLFRSNVVSINCRSISCRSISCRSTAGKTTGSVSLKDAESGEARKLFHLKKGGYMWADTEAFG